MQKGIKTFNFIFGNYFVYYDPTAEMQKGIKTDTEGVRYNPMNFIWPDRRNAKGDCTSRVNSEKLIVKNWYKLQRLIWLKINS